MSGGLVLWLAATMPVFLAGSAALKWHVTGGGVKALVLALVLYTLGNLMMVRLMRESGMGVAISVSAVLQLLLANAMAFGLFGERPSMQQLVGIGLGVVSVMLIVMPSAGPK